MKTKRFGVDLAILLTGLFGVGLLVQAATAGEESKAHKPAKRSQLPCATVCDFSTTQPAWVALKRAAREATPLKISVPVKTKDGVRINDIEIGYSKSRGIIDLDHVWKNGQTLVIEFVDHTQERDLLERIATYARQWQEYANLRFEFRVRGDGPPSRPAEIRVSLDYDAPPGAGLSSIGTDSLRDVNNPSMWLNVRTFEQGIQKVVRHEFGHALGFLHEHQHPQGVRWKQPEAMEYFRRAFGWDEEQIRRTIFEPVRGNLAASDFDKYSVMMYYFPPEITEDNLQVSLNPELSPLDKRGAAELYPPLFNRDVQAYVKTTPGFLKRGVTICALGANSPLRHLRDAAGRPVGVRAGSTLRTLGDIEVNDLADFKRAVDKADSHFRISYFDDERGALFTGVGPEKGDAKEWPTP